MKRFVKLLILCLTIAALGFVAYLYSSKKKAFEPFISPTNAPHEGVTVGLVDRPAAQPVYAMEQLLDSGPNRIKVIHYTSYHALWQAMAIQDLDMALVSLDQFALNVPRLNCAKVWFPYAEAEHSDAIVCAPSWNDAKKETRTVACVSETPSEYLAMCLTGISTDGKVQIVRAASQEQALTLLRTGQVDALATCQPHLQTLIDEGYQPIPDFTVPQMIEVWVVRNNMVSPRQNSNGEFDDSNIKTIRTAWFNLISNLQTQPGLIYPYLSQATSYSNAQLRSCLQNVHYLDSEESYQLMQTEFSTALENLLNAWTLSDFFASPFSRGKYNSNMLIAPSGRSDEERSRSAQRERRTRKPSPSPSPQVDPFGQLEDPLASPNAEGTASPMPAEERVKREIEIAPPTLPDKDTSEPAPTIPTASAKPQMDTAVIQKGEWDKDASSDDISATADTGAKPSTPTDSLNEGHSTPTAAPDFADGEVETVPDMQATNAPDSQDATNASTRHSHDQRARRGNGDVRSVPTNRVLELEP